MRPLRLEGNLRPRLALHSTHVHSDVDLATADHGDFTPAMRQGGTCARNADPTRTYWGDAAEEEWDVNRAKLYGCCKEKDLCKDV